MDLDIDVPSLKIDISKSEPTIKFNLSNTTNSPSIINPKPTTIRRPRNILRVDHLVSRRGIAALPEILSQTKFKGKGHELDDLKLLLFKMKHWAHRLFPGLTFEDFAAKTEHLGNKRTVKNFLNRIRTNQPLNFVQDRDLVYSDESDDEQRQDPNNQTQNNIDQAALNYDLLFKDHIEMVNKTNNIEKQQQITADNHMDNDNFDFEGISTEEYLLEQVDIFQSNNEKSQSNNNSNGQNKSCDA